MATINDTQEEVPVTDTTTHEIEVREVQVDRDRDYPWTLRAIKEFGFPVATALILMSILGFVGKWMIDNQQRLIESTVKTNESLTEANRQNALTLQTMERTMAANNASLIASLQENTSLVRDHYTLSKQNHDLNSKQVEILTGVTKAHELQMQQLGKINEIMDSAVKNDGAGAKQREEGLKKQDEQLQKLGELLEAVKKKT